MKQDSPAVHYFPQTHHSQNSSHSRIYLTRRNNPNSSPLHKTPQKHDLKAQVAGSASHASHSNGMSALTEDEILALPDSSTSDEDDGLHEVSTVRKNGSGSQVNLKRKGADTEVSSSRKRTRTTVDTLVATKAEQESNSRYPANEVLFAVPSSDPFDWLNSSQNNRSQSSQGKKKATYGKQKTFLSGNGNSAKHTLPDVPGDVSDGEEKHVSAEKRKSTKFVPVSDIPPTPKKARGRPKATLKTMPSDLEPEQPLKAFSMPDDDTVESSSQGGLLMMDQLNSTADQKNLQNRGRRKRSGSAGSSSSLSDVDSIVSLEMSQDQKEKLRAGLELSSSSSLQELAQGHIRCPICAQPVNEADVPRFMVDRRATKDAESPRKATTWEQKASSASYNPSRLSQQQQQDFCYQHSVHDAQIIWTKRKYPPLDTMNWKDFEAQKLRPHLSYLRAILYRKRPSHYLTLLERYIDSLSSSSSLKSNIHNKTAIGTKSRLIKKYLIQDLPDLVRPGYYGARGAKIMAQFITESLSKPLKLAMRSDRTVMDTGVSGFVSAVLLPELAVRVVIDDFDLLKKNNSSAGRGDDSNDDDNDARNEEEAEEQARKILDESSDVGLLLCPDDDHVERDVDD